MKLKDHLYHIIRSSEQEYEVLLDEQHFIYQAHFPGEPITPGVCVIQIAKELLEDRLHRDYEIKRVKNAKFLSVISPKKTPRVTYIFEKLTVSEETGDCKAQILVTTQEETLRQAQGPSLAKLSIEVKVKSDE